MALQAGGFVVTENRLLVLCSRWDREVTGTWGLCSLYEVKEISYTSLQCFHEHKIELCFNVWTILAHLLHLLHLQSLSPWTHRHGSRPHNYQLTGNIFYFDFFYYKESSYININIHVYQHFIDYYYRRNVSFFGTFSVTNLERLFCTNERRTTSAFKVRKPK